MKIVIVTYNWPPRNAIGTHRPYSWARYWSEAGAQVTVLTAQKKAFDAPLDLTLPELLNVKVIEVPYGTVSGLVNTLLASDLSRRFGKMVKAAIKRRTVLSIDPRMAWRKAAQPVAEALAQKSDIVVSTFGPAASHLIACDMKIANPNLRWVADYRDLWSQYPTDDSPATAHGRMRAVEIRSVGAYANLLTAVSDDMVRQLGDLTGRTVLKVPNGFDTDEELVRQRMEIQEPSPTGPLRIVYTGGIYKGDRDATPLLDTLARLAKRGEITIGAVTVDFYGSRVETAEGWLRNPEYAPFIRIMGHVPRHEAIYAQRSAGLLLLLESSEPRARGVLTGKLFEYIVAGRPIICIGSHPDFEIGQVLTATGTGTVFGKKDQAKLELALLQTLVGGGLFDSYKPDFDEVAKFSRKRIASDLLVALNKEVSKRR